MFPGRFEFDPVTWLLRAGARRCFERSCPSR
jgi:hypothetical protein